MLDFITILQLKESWEYDTAEERKTDAEKLKDKGNAFFKVSNGQPSLLNYQLGLFAKSKLNYI